jgi:hypothetical protein
LALITGPLLFGVYACGSLLGITDGTARDDAGLDAPIEATVGDEQPTNPDGGADASGEACVSKDVCVDHCGVTLDECGLTVRCPNECGDGKQCNAGTHVCECVSNPAWCTGRCGKTKDNCGKEVTCGGCPGVEACDLGTNSCGGCIPDNVKACTGKNCGSALNNCGQLANCGTCAGQCNSGQCCIPNPVCTGKSCGVFDNGCNQTIACGGNGGQCPTGGTCTTTSTCCFDDGKACQGKGCGTATNICGQSVQCANQCSSSQTCGTSTDPNACCTPSCAGKQCSATTGCVNGPQCSGIVCTGSNQCCIGESCQSNGVGGGKCQTGSCVGAGGTCSGPNGGCCYPLSCVFTAGGPDGGVGDGGPITATCQ